MDRPETAVSKFKEGYNCAQSVLFSYAERLQITADTALRISTGFGSGMGRKQEVCGAVSGSILVLSHIYGRGEEEGKDKQEMTYSKVRDFTAGFERKYGTVSCRQLLNGCDLSTAEGQETFKSDNMIEQCHEYVAYAVKLLAEIDKEQR